MADHPLPRQREIMRTYGLRFRSDDGKEEEDDVLLGVASAREVVMQAAD